MSDNKIIYCPNHPTVKMKKNDGYYALTALNKKNKNITFMPSSGIPIIVYFCPVCGKIETYVAQSDPDWENA